MTMASTAMLQSLLFRAPPSVYLTVMTVMTTLGMVSAGVNEMKGKNLQYSKMVRVNSDTKIPSKVGMTLFYLPTFLWSAASFFIFPTYDDPRFLLIRTALTIHFLKRLLETWFVHRYSGVMAMEAVYAVPLSYFMAVFNMIYAQYLSLGLPAPSMDMKYVGAAMFLTGTLGNLYHHCLLATLRKEGEKEYKIPRGGLFGLVICPHYLFEVVAFWGLAFVAQTWYAVGYAIGTTACLMGRSHATRKWSRSFSLRSSFGPKDKLNQTSIGLFSMFKNLEG